MPSSHPRSEPGVRARNRAEVERKIMRIAGEHLARDGAAGLSLRAVARELGMVSSAVYRYVASRDELLTLLIVEAYDSLGDAVDAALAAVSEPAARFRVIGRTLRAWAAAHPARFALVYGSPVPGYAAPGEQTTGPGTRVTGHLLEVLSHLDTQPSKGENASAAKALAPLLSMTGAGETGAGETGVGSAEVGSAEVGSGSPMQPGALLRGLAAWTLVLGAVRTEQFEEYGPDAVGDPDLYFELILDQALALLSRT